MLQEEEDRKAALELQAQQEKELQEERRYQEQLEQERQDRELALRLAQESNGQLEESPPLIRKLVQVFFIGKNCPNLLWCFTRKKKHQGMFVNCFIVYYVNTVYIVVAELNVSACCFHMIQRWDRCVSSAVHKVEQVFMTEKITK